MRQYILKRILLTIPVLLGVSLFIFSLVRLVPGDIVVLMLQESGNVSSEAAEQLRVELGLDKPFYIQYVVWLKKVFAGDFGESLWSRQPVLNELVKRIPITIELASLSMIFAILISIPVGVISALKQDKFADYAARSFSVAGISMPSFWIGTLLILLPSLWFAWSPPIIFRPIWKDPVSNLQQMIFPAIALGFNISAVSMRMTRSALLEVLRQEYIRTAWAKGLTGKLVIMRHALKNSMIPVITILGNQFGTLLGGTMIIETVFSLPGVGRLTVDSIFQRDYPQIQANVLFIALIFVFINLVVDILYAWLDPRIRYR